MTGSSISWHHHISSRHKYTSMIGIINLQFRVEAETCKLKLWGTDTAPGRIKEIELTFLVKTGKASWHQIMLPYRQNSLCKMHTVTALSCQHSTKHKESTTVTSNKSWCTYSFLILPYTNVRSVCWKLINNVARGVTSHNALIGSKQCTRGVTLHLFSDEKKGGARSRYIFPSLKECWPQHSYQGASSDPNIYLNKNKVTSQDQNLCTSNIGEPLKDHHDVQ